MTISSSLNAGVAGLNANAAKLSTISDNIANSATYGYKRAETDFFSVVMQGSASTDYSAGGVRVSSMRLIEDRGSLISTSNPTDLAIDGRGFFAVTEIGAVGNGTGTYPVSLATTGSFRADASGILRDPSGNVLMGWPASANGTIGSFPRDSVTALEPIRLSASQYVGNPTTEINLGANLPAAATVAGATSGPITLPVEYFGNLGNAETLTITFTPVVPATGASNEWTVEVSDSASNNQVIGEFTLQFSSDQATGGRLSAVTGVTGGAYDAATGKIDFAVAGGPMSLNLGRLGQPSGMTQLSNNFSASSVSKNGSPVASLVSVEVDGQGIMRAIYDQGFTRQIYQIPVIDVPNPNGLVSQTNQTYKVSNSSGPLYLWNAGDGPTGSVVGFSREESSTDVAAELTQLITTQRAYSSNAKVIQTVDEMLQETTNIKR